MDQVDGGGTKLLTRIATKIVLQGSHSPWFKNFFDFVQDGILGKKLKEHFLDGKKLQVVLRELTTSGMAVCTS